MENFVTDDFWNNFKYKNGCWFRRTDAPLLSSNGNLIFLKIASWQMVQRQPFTMQMGKREKIYL